MTSAVVAVPLLEVVKGKFNCYCKCPVRAFSHTLESEYKSTRYIV